MAKIKNFWISVAVVGFETSMATFLAGPPYFRIILAALAIEFMMTEPLY